MQNSVDVIRFCHHITVKRKYHPWRRWWHWARRFEKRYCP